MQAAQGFGRRGVKAGGGRSVVAAPASSAAQAPPPVEDEALAAFEAAAKADWAQARKERSKVAFWKRYPGMTALSIMAVIFILITVTPLHMSMTALSWIRGALGVGGLFGFGAKRLFRGKKGG
jgi:hypothetical protein